MRMWRRYQPNSKREMEAARLRYEVSGLLNEAVRAPKAEREVWTYDHIARHAQQPVKRIRDAFQGLSGCMTLDELACTLWAMGYRAEIKIASLDDQNGRHDEDA